MSYRTIHREVVRARRARGVPELPVLNTIYRSFEPGRTRLDVDLVVDIARVLLRHEPAVEQWRHACWVAAGLSSAAAIVEVADAWPDDLPSFTGRRAELEQILQPPDGRHPGAATVAIAGMPGVGKTRLAVRAGHLLLGRSGCGYVQLVVDLRGYDPDQPPADPGAVLEGFLRRLGESGDQIQHLDLAGRAAKCRQLLAGKRVLILLDNAASTEQVTPLLPDTPGCLAVITSRRTLPDLPDVRRMTLDVLSVPDAVDLLRRAGDSGVVDAEPDVAVNIVELLGCLPLALALAAGRIRANPDWTLADHLDRLRHLQRSLRVDDGVEVAVNASYDGLTAAEQRAFRTLALHPGGDIGRLAAAALTGADGEHVRRLLDQLTAASLLQCPTPDRWRFHNLVNTYATARAHDEDPASARRAALTRLSDHYLHAAAEAVDILHPQDKDRRPRIPQPASTPPALPDGAAARDYLDTERANLLAVAIHPDTPAPALMAFSATLHRYLAMTGQYRGAEVLHQHAVSTARQQGDRSGEAGALVNLGDLCLRTGRYEQATDHLQGGLAISRATGDLDEQGRALFHLGLVCILSGRYEQAAEYNSQALTCYQAIGNLYGEARAVGNLGWAYQQLGQFERAVGYHRQTLALCREMGDPDGEARVLVELGIICRLTGQLHVAADNHREALRLLREVGDREGEATALDNLGLLYQETGQIEQAADLHRQALTISREIGDRDDEARALNCLGSAHRLSGRYERAEDHHQQALSLYRELGDPGGQAIALNGLGGVARATGNPAQALSAHAGAHEHASKIGRRHEQARADEGLGHAYHDLGNPERARKHWQRALAVYEELGVPDAERVRGHLTAR